MKKRFLTLVVSIIAIYIFFIYRIVCKKTFYSKSFAVSLIAISIITSLVILAVKSSVVISLGMVGALSIVRYRTPIKEPMDLAFVFWSIAVGIICGANMYHIAIIGSIVITIILLLINFLPEIDSSNILVLNSNSNIKDEELNEIIKKYTKAFLMKSCNKTKENAEYVFEIKLKNENKSQIIDELLKKEEVANASILANVADGIF